MTDNKHFLLKVLETRSLRSGPEHGQVLDEGPLPGLQMATFLLYPYKMEKEKQTDPVS